MTTETPKAVSGKPEEAPIHSLFSRVIRPIGRWKRWLELWQAAATLEEMLGLLHVGFNVSFERGEYGEREYGNIDRIIFYLGIADGWTNQYLLKTPTDSGEYPFDKDRSGNTRRLEQSEFRQIVAVKAFDVLCLNFFGAEPDPGPNPDSEKFMKRWEKLVADDQLFLAITNSFFRAEQDAAGRVGIRNLSHRGGKLSHNEELAVAFLINLAEFLWRWREEWIGNWWGADEKSETKKRNAAMRARLEIAQPWMIEVLNWLGRLNVLERWILELSETCLTKLKEIALRSELSEYHPQHQVKKSRTVLTVDEACFVGSPAGWLLKRRELMERVHARLTAIREAERERDAAEQKLEELTPGS